MTNFVLIDVVMPDGGRRDLAVTDGTIVATPAPDATRHDASGFVALPRLVDSHIHLDKTFIGGAWMPNRPAATLLERIDAEVAHLDHGDAEPVALRAMRLIEVLVANGSTRIQSHVDIGPGPGLRRLTGVMEARERARDIARIDLVAFPQEGVMRAPGTLDLLRSALEMGVDAIGGLDPATLDGDREGQLDAIFGLATEFGVRIDIHLHEPGDVGAGTLRSIAAHTASNGLSGRVAVSHAYAFAGLAPTDVRSVASDLAAAGVTFVSAVPGGVRMPFDAIEEAGVRLVLGSDNIRDSWSPFGTGDVLERIALAAHDQQWYDDDRLVRALATVTTNPAAMLGEDAPQLRVGDAADFTLVPDTSVSAAVLGRPAGRVVFRAGRIVAAAGTVGPDLAWPVPAT
ncbi:MAG: cytosine deaminase [Ilumatobacteraceae bacterium]|nr:cytosine deaminase [Ilumatobacteraceae bacterium]